MRTDEFDYCLPEELIAQEPPAHRGESRMMVLDPVSGECAIHPFSDLPLFLNSGDVLARNDTKVIRARLFAHKDTGAKIEIFLMGLRDHRDNRVWSCMLKPAKRVGAGSVLQLWKHNGLELSSAKVTIEEKLEDGTCIAAFDCADMDAMLHECGHLPLPPYIKRSDAELDSDRYQTIYAQEPGAVAAPTAGLHFTPATFDALKRKGISIAELTLHVGAGTFKPVSAENVEEHHMHSEHYFFTEQAAQQLNQAREAGNRILAVGTTTLRTLETCVDDAGVFHAGSGATDIFLYPPYRIKSADMLLTNFHLPKSTLLMLVSTFAGKEQILNAYQKAIDAKMRFFSYGDCMLILNRRK